MNNFIFFLSGEYPLFIVFYRRTVLGLFKKQKTLNKTSAAVLAVLSNPRSDRPLLSSERAAFSEPVYVSEQVYASGQVYGGEEEVCDQV